MKEKNIGKKALFCAIMGTFVIVILFVSLLGENNKANDLVSGFLKNIQEHEYGQAAQLLPDISILNHASNPKEFDDMAFLLDLTLISHFNLLSKENYTFHITRDSFFIPLRGKNRITLSILLKQKEEGLLQSLDINEPMKPVHALFTVERTHGNWKIIKIGLDTSPLKEDFNRLCEAFRLHSGFKFTEKGFIIERIEYDPARVSPTEKRIYQHFLRKATRSISKD